MITMYEYVASHNPGMAISILNKYGYKPNEHTTSSKDLGVCLANLIATEGETALKDVVDMHPDKEVIIEMFGTSGGMAPIKNVDSWHFSADGFTHPSAPCG